MFGIQFITDIVDPADAQAGDDKTAVLVPGGGGRTVEQTDEETLKDEDRQWTLVLELGAMF
jgi:hypothetical protein